MDFTKELQTYVRAKYPVIYVPSVEERRVESACAKVAQTLGMELVLWSCTKGLTSLDGRDLVPDCTDPGAILKIIENETVRKLFVLRDFHPYLNPDSPMNVPVIRAVRDLGRTLKGAPKEQARAVVIVAPKLNLPDELRADVAVIEWALPTLADLRAVMDSTVPEALASTINAADRDAAANAALGLTLEEAQNCAARSLVATRGLDPSLIAQEKKQAVARDGILEWIEPDATLENIGGLEVLKAWLLQRQRAFSPEAKAYGLPDPKGVLCVGVPGSGKSMSARAIATAWQCPLLRLDVGRVFGALVGQSEEQIRKALKTAEAVGRCVLWLDEIEKAFAGVGAQAADAGTSARVFGSFLTWMQEKKAPCFVYATGNDVAVLPPELLRKGRFDEVFAIDLPTTAERKAIWEAQGRRYKKPVAIEYAPSLAQATTGYTGAEIEAILVSAMFVAFNENTEPTPQHLVNAIAETVPLSKTAAEKIQALRDWAKGRARSASLSETVTSGNRAVEIS